LTVGRFRPRRKKDLVVFPGSVDFLLGNGDGSIPARVEGIFGWFSFVFFTGTGDFNDDGKLDLIRESCTLHIFPFRGRLLRDSLWLGNGDGTFQPPVALDPVGAGWLTSMGIANSIL
jgi:hypothetical protein